MIKAVIMAGGKGTRLQSINKDIPKPMFPVLSKPILEYQIESLKKSGIDDITIIVGHLGDVIKEYFDDGKKWGVNISYITEETPLGTAGALHYLNGKIEDDFLLVFGDLILDIDWNKFVKFHREKGAYITLFAHPNAHPYDSDLIVADKNGLVTGFDSKKNDRSTYYYENTVNAGLYCFSKEAIKGLTEPVKIDLEKELIVSFIDDKKVFAYKSTEYVKDMGTPERLNMVTEDVKAGVLERRSLKNPQKAVFLDRDGTINKLNGFIKNVDEFELIDGVTEAIKLLNSSGYLTIVITNQPVIARGECTEAELSNIHKKMQTILGNSGAYVDDIFYCPHHPDKGFEGEVPELKIKCDCRKPGIGMLKKAAEIYNVDLSASWFVGDATMDIKTGNNAGCSTILLKTGMAGEDGKYDISPDYTENTLLDAVRLILDKSC